MKKLYFTSLALVGLGALGFASAEAPPSKGRIPARAMASSKIDLDLAPDYIVAYARDGKVAGYIRKGELFDEKGERRHERLLVLDESLKQPVGHMVPGRGFVPIGVRDEAIPAFDLDK